MFKTVIILLAFGFVLVTFAGCSAHTTMRGSVVMKINKRVGHVCLGNEEVKRGDRVVVHQNVCENQTSGKNELTQTCRRVKSGFGTVTRLLNKHYSEVTFDQGVVFKEGTTVEVKRKGK